MQNTDSCDLSRTSFAAGVATFVVENMSKGSSEFYVYKPDGKSIVSEVENIGPGLTRELTVELAEGSYVYSCEQADGSNPMNGKLTVTAAAMAASTDQESLAAVAAYREFVSSQAELLLAATQKFADAVKSKNVAAAKSIYPEARSFWERIEPVAESFGDLDPKMDAREGDLEPGVKWTGWHALEKQLWVTGLAADSAALADGLVADTKDLVSRIATVQLTLSQVSNGAKELMDEVATGKVTGEEERYSHTDLWDFAANVEGAQKAVQVSADLLKNKDAGLLTTLNATFSALTMELEKYKTAGGYRLYTELSPAEVKSLADLVEAVSEPLSKMTAALVK
jgi:iron uptake system component EfeO